MLHTLVLDSLAIGLRGSSTVTPSTLNAYRYAGDHPADPRTDMLFPPLVITLF